MTLNSIWTLFTAMVILALIPSISVLTVITRTTMFGFIHGIVTIGGILMGDIIFILIAIGGLSFLAEVMGGFFVGIKYFGGAYLIFLGIKLCKSKSNNTITEKSINSSLLSSFLTGLSITLADQKAILFYLGFFPAFVNLSQISYLDIGIILTTAIIAVGGVKIIYALMADKIRLFFDDKTRKKINILAGGMMIFIGLFLFIKF